MNVYGGVIAIGLFLAALLVAGLFGKALEWYIAWSFDRLMPDLQIIGELTTVLITCGNPQLARGLDSRSAAIRALERSADLVLSALLPGLSTGEGTTDAWIMRQLTLTASYLRYLKRGLALPVADDWCGLADATACTIERIVHQHWGALRDERIDAQLLDSESVSNKERLATIARSLIVGMLPLIVVLVLVLSHVLPAVSATPLLAVTGSFAGITLLAVLDPHSPENLKTALSEQLLKSLPSSSRTS